MKLFSEKRIHFPSPELTTDDGLVSISDELSVEILLEAYSFGIFPWPHEEMPLLWFSPLERGVLEFENLHLPKSFKKFLKKTNFKITFNTCFERVMDYCSSVPRLDQSGTWITPHLKKHYIEFHKAGYAHSVECWDGGELVGGLYGVYVGGVFSGESMFCLKSNASKFALWKLIEKLNEQEIRWLDIQMVTEVLEAFGGQYIHRSEFLTRLETSKKKAQPLLL